MSLQLQQVVCRRQNASLPHGRSHIFKPQFPSPLSNISFVSSVIQKNPLLQSSYSLNSNALTAKRAPPALQIVAAYSVDRDYMAESPAKALRRILETPGVHQGPVCFDALSAKLVERAGFSFCFAGGFAISAARLGLPDTGLISYGEMVEQGRQITEAVSVPVIGDADNGYGNAMNVKRTVKGYIKAGFAGIILEDQVTPKACGHTQGRKVVSREEAVLRIKAAIDARKESGSDIVIIAQTDARQAFSFDEALWRIRAFADAGADVVFIDALASKEEMKAFCDTAPLVPKLANMLEGGGKTPILNPLELADVGFKLVTYPLSLLGVSIQAMQDALFAIRGGRIPPLGSMPSFEKIKEILGFNNYYEEEKRYAIRASPLSSQIGEKQRYQSPQYPITTETYYGVDGTRSTSSRVLSRKLRINVTGRDGYEKINTRVPAGYLEGIINIVPALGGVNIKALVEEAADAVGEKLLIDFFDVTGDRIQVFLE
ncbi:hypothetical protein UlMin_010632 [Ulmus minor]